ncbi:hypothetical protein LXL04_011114 [Taraxacum kok-saghyz]
MNLLGKLSAESWGWVYSSEQTRTRGVCMVVSGGHGLMITSAEPSCQSGYFENQKIPENSRTFFRPLDHILIKILITEKQTRRTIVVATDQPEILPNRKFGLVLPNEKAEKHDRRTCPQRIEDENKKSMEQDSHGPWNCWDLLRTHIFPRTRELPQFPISPKPLFLSKNRLRNPPKPVLKQNKKLCTYAQKKSLHICKVFGKKKSFFRKKIFATGLIFERFLAPRSRFFEKVNESRSFENSYIPENPRTPKPLTFSKNRLRGAKNRSNISPVAKKNFRKNDFFFSKNFAYVQTFFFVHMCTRIVMIKNVLEGSEVGFLKGITGVRVNFHRQKINKEKGKKEPLALGLVHTTSLFLSATHCRLKLPAGKKMEWGAVLPPAKRGHIGFLIGNTLPHR